MFRKVFRKTPLAWLQMSREKTRLLVALAGIAFADILMFLQLGFKDALLDSAVKPYMVLQGDLFIINPKFETLILVQSFSKARLYQTLGFEGVESVSHIYVAIGAWRNPKTKTDRNIMIFGIDPAYSAFNLPEVNQNLNKLKMLDWVLFDQGGRSEYGPIAEMFNQSGFVETEIFNVLVRVGGLFTLGASFAADGNIITSDSTFLHVFDNREPDEIDIGLIKLEPGADIEQVQANLKANLPRDVEILTKEELAEREEQYWANATPIGFVFGLGTVVGFVVGTVIVYQILYSDVSEHLPEYATLKAMGYGDGYLIGVLIQESLILAVLGFIPGFVVSLGLYRVGIIATGLPIVMTFPRVVTVIGLTIIMCSASGAIAMRKLRSADPADIF
jgi:putative ABC transport system permease protein